MDWKEPRTVAITMLESDLQMVLVALDRSIESLELEAEAGDAPAGAVQFLIDAASEARRQIAHSLNL